MVTCGSERVNHGSTMDTHLVFTIKMVLSSSLLQFYITELLRIIFFFISQGSKVFSVTCIVYWSTFYKYQNLSPQDFVMIEQVMELSTLEMDVE